MKSLSDTSITSSSSSSSTSSSLVNPGNSVNHSTPENTVTTMNDVVNDDQTHQSPSTIHSIPSPVTSTTKEKISMSKTTTKTTVKTSPASSTLSTSMNKKPIKPINKTTTTTTTKTTTTTARSGTKSTLNRSVINTRTQSIDKKNGTNSVKTMNSNSNSNSNQGVKAVEKKKKKLSQHLIRPKFGPSSRKVNSTTNNNVNANANVSTTSDHPLPEVQSAIELNDNREKMELSRTIEQSTGKK